MSPRSRADDLELPDAWLLTLPSDSLDSIVAILCDAGETYWVKAVCTRLRAAVARVRATGRFLGRSGGSTKMKTVFDTPQRLMWIFNEAFHMGTLKNHKRLFVPVNGDLTAGDAELSTDFKDYRLSLEGLAACALSKATDAELLAYMKPHPSKKPHSLLLHSEFMSTVCEAGREQLVLQFLKDAHEFTSSLERLDTMRLDTMCLHRLHTWVSCSRSPGKDLIAVEIKRFPYVLHALKEFKTCVLLPAATGGHVGIWTASIEYFARHELLSGMSLREWMDYFVDSSLWVGIVSSGNFKAFHDLMTRSTTSKKIFKGVTPAASPHDRAAFVRGMDLAAVIATIDSNGMKAEPWAWMMNFTRSIGDVTCSGFLELRVWIREHARTASLEVGSGTTIGFPTQAMAYGKLPMVQSVAVYDLFLKESHAEGFFNKMLLDNFSRALPRASNTMLARLRSISIDTHAEAILGFVVLDFWANWVGGNGGDCFGMNDNLAALLERAAFHVLSCHQLAYHGAIVAAVAMRGYSVARLREVLKRAHEVLLADGLDKEARQQASNDIQRVVTVPMMARAALCKDLPTWEWCLSPTTAHHRPLPNVTTFSTAQLLRIATNATVRGARPIVAWCLRGLGSKQAPVTTALLRHMLFCPTTAELTLPYLMRAKAKGSYTRTLDSFARQAMEASPEAISACLGADLYKDLSERTTDSQLEIDVTFRLAHMQQNHVRMAFPDVHKQVIGSSEKWLASRYRYYKLRTSDWEADNDEVYTGDLWELHTNEL